MEFGGGADGLLQRASLARGAGNSRAYPTSHDARQVPRFSRHLGRCHDGDDGAQEIAKRVERAAARRDLKEDWRRMDPVRALCCFGGPKRDCGAGKNVSSQSETSRFRQNQNQGPGYLQPRSAATLTGERRDLQDCSGLQRKLLLNLILLILLVVSMRSTAIPFISLGCIVALQAQTPSPALVGARPGATTASPVASPEITPTSSGTAVPVPQSTPPKLTDILFKNFKARSIGPAAMGGRVSDIAIDPRNPAVFFIGLST